MHNGGDSVAAHVTTVTGSRAVTASTTSMTHKGNSRKGWTLKSPCSQPLTSSSKVTPRPSQRAPQTGNQLFKYTNTHRDTHI